MYPLMIVFILTLSLFSNCSKDKSKSSSLIEPSAPIKKLNLHKVEINNSNILIRGDNLSQVTNFKIKYNNSNLNTSINSKNENEITLSLAETYSTFLNLNLIQGLIIQTVSASEFIPLDINLCNASLSNAKISCSLQPKNLDVLSFDSSDNSWKPRSINALNYLGIFDASFGTYPTTTDVSSGSYYIVEAEGIINGIQFRKGDWIIFNSTNWDKIDNSNFVTSVFGRTGSIVAQRGDYSLSMLSDINMSPPPKNGDLLSYDLNSNKWIPFTLQTSPPPSSNITSTDELAEGVSNLYFNSQRVFDSINSSFVPKYSKINSTDKLSVAIEKLQGQIDQSQPLILSSDITHYYRGDKSWSIFKNDVLNTKLESFTTTTGSIDSSDSLYTAISKIAGNMNLKLNSTTDSTITAFFNFISPGGLSVPTATGANLNEVANVQYISSYIDQIFGIYSNTLQIKKEKVAINKTQGRSTLDVNGQISSTSFTSSTNNIDWSYGNTTTTNTDCSNPINFNNLLDGGSYTLAVTSSNSTMCSFNSTVTGENSGTVFFKFNPPNSSRNINTHTIYSIIRIGNIGYVSWISGF